MLGNLTVQFHIFVLLLLNKLEQSMSGETGEVEIGHCCHFVYAHCTLLEVMVLHSDTYVYRAHLENFQ